MPPRIKADLPYEERIQMALRALRTGQEPNVPAASESFEVKQRTLYRHFAGTTKNTVEAHEGQQQLTNQEEKAIVKWCFCQDDIGFLPRLDMLKDMAVCLERKRTGSEPPPIGKNWMSRFLKRHSDLALKLSTQLERQHTYANDPQILQLYFGKLGRLIKQHTSSLRRPFQIYNIDEKWFLMGLAARAKVLCRRGRRNPT